MVCRLEKSYLRLSWRLQSVFCQSTENVFFRLKFGDHMSKNLFCFEPACKANTDLRSFVINSNRSFYNISINVQWLY